MMMPANYSVIAENEMTYVVGGGLVETLGKYTAPIWNDANIKTFNTNVVTLIGNLYVDKFVNKTIAAIFGGNTTKKAVGESFKSLFTTDVKGNEIKKWNIGDGAANILGLTAAVYNLGRADVKNVAKDYTITLA